MTGWLHAHGLKALGIQVFFISVGAFAASPPPVVDLKAAAQNEIHQAGKLSSSSTNAQVSSGMLSLKDPMPEIRGRNWDYFLRMTVQSFQPRGTGGNDLTETRFAIGENSSTVLPSVAVGAQARLLNHESFSVDAGIGARIAYTTEKATSRFSSGYVERDAQLNAMLVGVDPYLRWTLTRLPRLALTTGAEFGNVTYTQSSSNKLAAFSEHAPYTGVGAGLEFGLTAHTALLIDYVHRSVAADRNAQLPVDNYELGTRITW